jgi:NADH-quinone oxidoreductase subunit K
MFFSFVEKWSSFDSTMVLKTKLLYSHELLPLALCIFFIGFLGFLESKDFLSLLINTEIIMLGLNFYLITSSLVWGDYTGQVYALCFLAITAAETAIGLGLLILLYRTKGNIIFTEFSTLKG